MCRSERSTWSSAEIQSAFSEYSASSLGYRELQRALRGIGAEIDDREAVQVLRSCDADGSGQIELAEFSAMVRRLPLRRQSAQDPAQQPTQPPPRQPPQSSTSKQASERARDPARTRPPPPTDASTLTRESMLVEYDATSMSSRSRLLASAVAVGALTGVVVSAFKRAISASATLLYGSDVTHGWVGTSERLALPSLFLPAFGGLLVGGLRAACLRGAGGRGAGGRLKLVWPPLVGRAQSILKI